MRNSIADINILFEKHGRKRRVEVKDKKNILCIYESLIAAVLALYGENQGVVLGFFHL